MLAPVGPGLPRVWLWVWESPHWARREGGALNLRPQGGWPELPMGLPVATSKYLHQQGPSVSRQACLCGTRSPSVHPHSWPCPPMPSQAPQDPREASHAIQEGLSLLLKKVTKRLISQEADTAARAVRCSSHLWGCHSPSRGHPLPGKVVRVVLGKCVGKHNRDPH